MSNTNYTYAKSIGFSALENGTVPVFRYGRWWLRSRRITVPAPIMNVVCELDGRYGRTQYITVQNLRILQVSSVCIYLLH